MEFKHLQSFVAVVKYGSFTKAAESLFISQPTISAHINALEEELHKVLIIRTTKSIEITPKGMEVYEYAVNILDLGTRMISICNEEERRTIHLGTSTIPSSYILPDILPEFTKTHTDTYFIIHQSDSQGIIDGLLDGIFDVGFIGMQDEKLMCEPFWQDRMVLITPVTETFQVMKQKPNLPLEELLKEPIILREKGSGSSKSVNYFLEMIGKTEKQLRVVACINDQESIKNLVAEGLGIAIISETAARNFVKEKRLLQFELPAYNRRNLYLAYRKNHLHKPQIYDFVNFIHQKYKHNHI